MASTHRYDRVPVARRSQPREPHCQVTLAAIDAETAREGSKWTTTATPAVRLTGLLSTMLPAQACWTCSRCRALCRSSGGLGTVAPAARCDWQQCCHFICCAPSNINSHLPLAGLAQSTAHASGVIVPAIACNCSAQQNPVNLACAHQHLSQLVRSTSLDCSQAHSMRPAATNDHLYAPKVFKNDCLIDAV